MKLKKILLLLSIYKIIFGLFIIPLNTFGKTAITIGPMIHYYFNKAESRWSFGFEVAYWSIKNSLQIPYSVDLGFEFYKEKTIIYSELQTGIIFLGASFGICMESFQKEKKNKYGIQGSVWTNFLLGLDYRIRYIDLKHSKALGTYIKFAPISEIVP